MKRGLVLAAGLGVALLLTLWLVDAFETVEANGAGVHLPAPGATRARLEQGTSPATEPAAAEDRREVAARRIAATQSAEAAPRDDRLTGEVRDHVGRPLEGAEVLVRRRATAGMTSLDLAANRMTTPVGSTTTDSTGRFALEVPPHRPLELLVEAPRHARELLEGIFGGEHVQVDLELGATIEGRLTRAATGRPVPGVRLRGWTLRPRRRDLIDIRTDAGGAFHVDGLPPGELTLSVEPETLASPAWATIELAAGDRARRDYELEDGVAIHGTVTDASTGAPIADAEVGAGWTFRRSVRTDSEGRYELRGFGGPGVYEVFARAPDHGKAQHEFRHDDMPAQDFELDFALPPARSAVGRVAGPDGEPFEGAYVAGVASQFEGRMQRTDWDATRTDDQGRFRLASLTPDLRHQLLVRATGYGTLVLDFPPDEAEHPELDLGTIRLERGGRIVGVVVDEHGSPRPGLEVRLSGRGDEDGRYLPEGAELLDVWYTDSFESRTDRRGRFHFADLDAGSYVVRVEERGSAADASRSVVLGRGERREDLVLELATGLAIRGRVLDGHGDPCEHVTVRVRGPGGSGRSSTDDQGRFAVTGLGAGSYSLHADPSWFNHHEARAEDGRELFEARQDEVAAGDEAVLVTLPEARPVRGRVLAADGEPAARIGVMARDPVSGERVAHARADEEGRFRLALPEGAVVDLLTHGVEDLEHGGYRHLDPTPEDAVLSGIEAGSEDVELRLGR